jgi:ketosteroid isomerase-like protein
VAEGAITEADIERMKEGFALYNRGDFDGLRQFIADDVIVERVGDLHPIQGWSAFREQILEPDAFEWMRMDPRTWLVNGDKVLLHTEIRAKGAASGIEMEIEGWMVWTASDGIVVRIASFTDEGEARAAAGLGQNAPRDRLRTD